MADGHEQNLEMYECAIGDLPAFVTVDMNLHSSAPQNGRQVLADLRLALRQPRENGLPVKEESSRIYELEDLIESTLTGRCDCVLAGKIWTGGFRKLYFYCAKADALGRALQDVADSLKPYEVNLSSFQDPEWSSYFDNLYPNDLAFQYIADRKTVDTLAEHGDTLETPRKVDHWAYFETEAQRAAFVGEIKKDAFQVESLDKLEEGESPYGVAFSRVDSVVLSNFCRITERLFILAGKLGGTYDGWESEVVTG